LGCSEEQRHKIIYRLESVPHALCHPLLPVGILWELDRDRLIRRVRQLRDLAVLTNERLRQRYQSREEEESDDNDEALPDMLSLRFDYSHLMNELKASRAQILRVYEHDSDRYPRCRERSGREKTSRRGLALGDIGHRIKACLLEIADDLQAKANTCQTDLEDITFSTHMVS
jgi:hypothetical protein